MEDEFMDYEEPEFDEPINNFIERIFEPNRLNSYNTYQPNISPLIRPRQYFQNSIVNLLTEFSTAIMTEIDDEFYMDFGRSIFEDPIERVMHESMETNTGSLVKTDKIIKIPVSKFKLFDEFFRKENTSCSICLSDFEDESEVSVTGCKHAFHNECIIEWGKYKIDCPICREKIEN